MVSKWKRTITLEEAQTTMVRGRSLFDHLMRLLASFFRDDPSECLAFGAIRKDKRRLWCCVNADSESTIRGYAPGRIFVAHIRNLETKVRRLGISLDCSLSKELVEELTRVSNERLYRLK